MVDARRERPKVLDIDYVESQPVVKNEDEGVENFKRWFREKR